MRAVFSLHDAGEIHDLMSDAGFADIEARSDTKTLRLPPPEQFLWQNVHSTPLAAAAAELDERGGAELERDVAAQWQPFVDGGLVLELGVTVAQARRSD